MKGHVIDNCKHIHLILDREKVAAKYYFSIPSKNRTLILRKRNKKFNSKSIMKNLNATIGGLKIEEINQKEEDDDIYENSDLTGSCNRNQEYAAATLRSTITKELPLELNDSSQTLKQHTLGRTNTFYRNHNYTGLQSGHTLTMMMIEKKNEESSLENIMKEFEKLKNYEFYYPNWNIDIVLKKYEEQRRKKLIKKRTQKTNHSD